MVQAAGSGVHSTLRRLLQHCDRTYHAITESRIVPGHVSFHMPWRLHVALFHILQGYPAVSLDRAINREIDVFQCSREFLHQSDYQACRSQTFQQRNISGSDCTETSAINITSSTHLHMYRCLQVSWTCACCHISLTSSHMLGSM